MAWPLSNPVLPLLVAGLVTLGVSGWLWGRRVGRPWLEALRTPLTAGTRHRRLPGFGPDLHDLRPIAREAVIDAMQEGVLVLDRGGRVVDLNPAARGLVAAADGAGSGRLLEELLRRHAELLELLPPRLSSFRSRIEIGHRTLELRSSPLAHRGAPAGRLLVVGDVTAAARSEAELRRAKRAAEAADRAKGQFLAAMSHELRSPLTAVIGYADLLASGALGELNEEQREHTTEILGAGKRLLGVITDVLDYAHLEGGRERPVAVRVDAVVLAREVAEGCRARLTGPDRSFRLELPPEPLWLSTDASKLRRILAHLLANAEKFTSHGSIVLRLRRDGDGALFEVADSGIGIPAEQQRLIFEAFAQGDAGDARRFGGSGLGLAICRRYSELIGAELDLRSVVGEGSSFTLRLPAGEGARAQTAASGRVTIA